MALVELMLKECFYSAEAQNLFEADRMTMGREYRQIPKCKLVEATKKKDLIHRRYKLESK